MIDALLAPADRDPADIDPTLFPPFQGRRHHIPHERNTQPQADQTRSDPDHPLKKPSSRTDRCAGNMRVVLYLWPGLVHGLLAVNRRLRRMHSGGPAHP